jgi:FkbM family methyltransferase
MYNKVTQEFTAYNGEKFTFAYREDTNDFNTILSITRDDEYLTSKMTYQPNDVFVDIGAHIGIWGALMQRLVPDSTILAVEPLPENIELIQLNVKDTYNVGINPSAVSNRSGMKTKIYYANDTEGGLHHKFVGNIAGKFKGDKFYLAETINLQDLLKDIPHVRVLKIDCEGGEHQFFRFATKETLSKIDYIIGEYHNFEPQSASRTRASLFKSMKGLFEDIGEPSEATVGPFWFKRIE